MAIRNTGVIMLAGWALVLAGSCGGGPPGAPAKVEATPQVTPVGVNQSWIVVKENTFIPVVDNLGERLAAGADAFDDGQLAAAGDELERGAELLDRQRADAGEMAKAELLDAAVDLRGVATDLARGVPPDQEQFDEAVDGAWQAEIDTRWATLVGRDWQPFAREPERYLEMGRAGFAAADLEAASRDFRRAAAFVRMEAARGAAVGEQERMIASWMDLRELAEEVGSGDVHEVARVDRVLARTAQAVGRVHQLHAAAELQRGDPESAAASLGAATVYVDRALVWSDAPVEPADEAVLADARAAAAQAPGGSEEESQSLSAQIGAVGDVLDRLGRSLFTEVEQEDLRQSD